MILGRSGGYEIGREGHLVTFRVHAGGGFVILIAGVVAAVLAVGVWGLTLWTLWRAFGDTGGEFSKAAESAKMAVVLTISAVALLLGRTRGPRKKAPPFMVADLQQRVLFDGRGNPLAPLDQCRAVKGMLITSSATAVELRWAGGTREVFRGDLMGGGVADVLSALHEAGFSH